MCVTDDGTVYVTDSIGGGVYRLHGDLETANWKKLLTDFLAAKSVPARDGKRLFVPTTPWNCCDRSGDGKVSYLPHPENIAVVALDGLYLSGDSLVGMQNGTDPSGFCDCG